MLPRARLVAIVVVLVMFGPAAAGAGAMKRCGWVENPTPGNWSLQDRDGTWILSEQGGYSSDGLDNLPDMTTRGWINRNGVHGYGCGCIEVETAGNRYVTHLVSAEALPIGTCRADRRLPPP